MIKFKSEAERGYITALFSAVLISLFILIVCCALISYGRNSYGVKEAGAVQSMISDVGETADVLTSDGENTGPNVSDSDTEMNLTDETLEGEISESETENTTESVESTEESADESDFETTSSLIFPGQNNNQLGNIAGEIKDEITGSRALAFIGIILSIIIAVAVILLIILLLQRREFKELPIEKKGREDTDETKNTDRGKDGIK